MSIAVISQSEVSIVVISQSEVSIVMISQSEESIVVINQSEVSIVVVQPMRADLQQGVDHPVPEVGVVVLLVVGSLVRDAADRHHIGRGPGLCRTRSGALYISFNIGIL